jgi:tetratricopeptide (TPR) repeat protein
VTGAHGRAQAAVSDQLGLELRAFEAMSQADPKNVSLHYTVGMLYQLAGRPQEVCDHLYEAYMLAPEATDPQLLFHLANNLKAIGENDAAVNFYALAIGEAPPARVPAPPAPGAQPPAAAGPAADRAAADGLPPRLHTRQARCQRGR